MEFEYDNLKRVISYNYSYYDSTTGVDNYYSKSYIYNSNGLPVYASYTKQLAQQGQFYAGKELYFYTK